MVPDPEILRRMETFTWRYSEEDPVALAELRRRIQECGRRRGLLSYSDLVTGIEFRIPSIWAEPHSIFIRDWQPMERRAIGDFLGCLSTESYREAGFMASALVVGKYADQPSEHFFEWMEFLQALPNLHQNTVLRFWVEQVRAAHLHYMQMQ